jgi:C4-type Zn-finger protein
MAKFTASQANACTISMINKNTRGSDIWWTISVNDGDGNSYSYEDNTLSEDPSKSEIKAAVKIYLVTIEKKLAPTIITVEDFAEEDKGVGELIG